MSKLPDKIIQFKSSDKDHHQQPDMIDLANCCTPVFCIIAGNVNCGKTSLLKNLLIHKKPPYERIVIYSPLGEATNEYSDDIDCELVDYIPYFDYFDREVRNCFIVEDCDTKSLCKDEKYKLGRFFGVYASHNNIDIFVIAQNVYDLLPQIRRLCNICFLFKNHDLESMTSIARKFGMKVGDTRSTMRLRKNIFESINLNCFSTFF